MTLERPNVFELFVADTAAIKLLIGMNHSYMIFHLATEDKTLTTDLTTKLTFRMLRLPMTPEV